VNRRHRFRNQLVASCCPVIGVLRLSHHWSLLQAWSGPASCSGAVPTWPRHMTTLGTALGNRHAYGSSTPVPLASNPACILCKRPVQGLRTNHENPESGQITEPCYPPGAGGSSQPLNPAWPAERLRPHALRSQIVLASL